MRKDRFLELVNLHLDNEIQPDESKELFDAMALSEEYRSIYNDYCRLTAACASLGPQEVGVKRRLNFSQFVYAVGGLAAAIALVGLSVRNVAPFFQETDVPTFTAVSSQMAQDSVLAPTQAVVATTMPSNFNLEGHNYKIDGIVTPASLGNQGGSWKQGLQNDLIATDYELSHELTLALDEEVRKASSIGDYSRSANGFLNYSVPLSEVLGVTDASREKERPKMGIQFEVAPLISVKR